MAIPMEWLFSWEVSSWVVGGAIAAAFSFLALDDFKLAKLFFLLAAADAVGGIVMWGAKTDLPPWGRSLLIFVMIGSIGLLAVQALRYVDKKQRAKQPQSRSLEIQPSVSLIAYLQPGQPYPDGTIVGGISWLTRYVDVRLDVVNGPTQIKDLDLSVQLDTDIAAIGQISQFQGVTAFPDNDPSAAWLEGTDANGEPMSVPIVPAAGKMRSSPVYRVHCSEVLANTVVHLVIASIAFNRPTVSGQLPERLFAPRRAPREIRVKGRYAVQERDSSMWHPIDFSYSFPQPSALPPPPKLAAEPKPQESAKLQFTFWPVSPNDEKLLDEVSVPVVNGIVTVVFSAKNVGTTQADNGQVWIQICDACKFAEEPEGTTMPPGDPLVRRKRFDTLHTGSYFEGTALKTIPPDRAAWFTIALKYACERCPPIDNRHPQKLRVNIAERSSQQRVPSQSDVTPPTYQQLAVEWSRVYAPRIPSDGRVSVVSLFDVPEGQGDGSLGESSGEPGRVFTTPDADGMPMATLQYRLTNYASATMFNITIVLRLIFQEAIKRKDNPKSEDSGKITLERDWVINIPKIDSGPDRTFTFYVMNTTGKFVTVYFPNKVLAQMAGSGEQRTVELIKPTAEMNNLPPIR
jgi:hypothetical protein